MSALSRRACALDYPARPVRLLVGFAPGGTADIAARLIGQSLSEHLGQQFVVENRPGASSNVATEAVARATPDGYALLDVTATNSVGMSKKAPGANAVLDLCSFESIDQDKVPALGVGVFSPLEFVELILSVATNH